MRIRFTILKSNLERGFLLIDVLIAAAIIGFFALPVTVGLLNSVASANYARDVYKATLYANNLLIDFETAIRLGIEIDSMLDEPEDVIENFHADYETDVYDYIVGIGVYDNAGLIQSAGMSTNALGAAGVGPATVSGLPGQLLADYPDAQEIIKADGGFSLISGSYTSFAVGLCEVIVPAYASENIGANIYIEDSDEELKVRLVNNSAYGVFTRIYGEGESDGLSVEICGSGAPSVVGFYRQEERRVYIMLVEVLDKKGRSLVYKAKPVFV